MEIIDFRHRSESVRENEQFTYESLLYLGMSTCKFGAIVSGNINIFSKLRNCTGIEDEDIAGCHFRSVITIDTKKIRAHDDIASRSLVTPPRSYRCTHTNQFEEIRITSLICTTREMHTRAMQVCARNNLLHISTVPDIFFSRWTKVLFVYRKICTHSKRFFRNALGLFILDYS